MNRHIIFAGRIFVLCLCLVLFNITISAQGGAITYGSGASGTLSATAPFAFYTFSGNTDDLISVQVIALTPGVQPSIGLNSPTQQQLAFNTGDPFNPGVARVTYRLPQTGTYTILVSSSGSTGDFAIRLDGSPAPPATELTDEASTESSVTPGSPPLVYSVQTNPDSPTIVTISSDTSGFAFAAVVRDSNGQTTATYTGSASQAIIATLPVGNTSYEIEVRPIDPAATGNIQVSIGLINGEPTTATDEPTIDATEEVDAPPPATTEEVDGACVATNSSGNNVNVRSGPGTNYDVVNSLQTNAQVPVLGVNSPSGWYLLSLSNNAQGWVFGDLLTLTGDCSQLDEVAAPEVQPTSTTAPQAVPPTATSEQQQQPQPTTTTAQQQQPTATPTPSYTPTTPPPPQVAPEDSRFNNPLTIPLDSTASVTDFVSYPGGDREDRVRYSVSGMNSNSSLPGGRARLILAVSCFGNNTDQIQFFTGGNTYSCGQTIFDNEVTFDSNTGSVVITAIGGEGTYVQWVLTGTATRVN